MFGWQRGRTSFPQGSALGRVRWHAEPSEQWPSGAFRVVCALGVDGAGAALNRAQTWSASHAAPVVLNHCRSNNGSKKGSLCNSKLVFAVGTFQPFYIILLFLLFE